MLVPPVPRLRRAVGALVVALLAPFPAAQLKANNALHPAQITLSQADQFPYLCSGRVEVNFGDGAYIGTASSVRRYTCLTAGHLVYDPKTGFGTDLRYEPALYEDPLTTINVSSFAALSGYQAAAQGTGPNSDAAFNLDSAYLVLDSPVGSGSLAPWASAPDDLLAANQFLVLGYAAQRLSGDALAYIADSTPYYVVDDAPNLYESTAYYTEGGMSGGPVYATTSDGTTRICAVNVAGTDYSDPAYSDARIISADEVPLLTEVEYQHGLITGGVISGKPKIKAGKVKVYMAGATFADGQSETVGLPAKYDELMLYATGANKGLVTIAKVMDGTYDVTVVAGTPSGTPLTLKLFRDDLKRKQQTVLQVLQITVK